MKLSLESANRMMEQSGGSLDLSGTGITSNDAKRIRKLSDGDCVPGRWIYADGLLTHVKRAKAV